MKTRALRNFGVGVLITAHTFIAAGQGTFQNLDFELANLPVIPAGQFGSLQPMSVALPNWTGFLGSVAVSSALQNSYSLGSPSVGIIGPNWTSVPPNVIQGSYSAILQAGAISPDNYVSAILSQSGLVPSAAQSIRLRVQPFLTTDITQLSVSLDGQNIPLAILVTTSSYTLLGGDIVALAGATRELRIAANPILTDPFSSFAIDSIQFSNQPIPEPSAFSLFGLGALIFGGRWRIKRIV